jgi:ABC-type transport system involved in multi-copper enzyme maturation permease subunit
MGAEETVSYAAVPVGRRLWARQVAAMLGLELRKTFLRLRALPVVAVALLPVVLLGLRALAVEISGRAPMPAPQMATVYAGIFQLFFLRLVVFFGCFGIFTYLVRGEVAERSLHFYLLAPLRREVYLAGKYVAGFVAASALFLASLAGQLGFAFLTVSTEGGGAYVSRGPGLGQALAYAGVTVLAVAGYGAVFTALALVARNPMLPAAAILGWEWINFLLPPALKRISVIHHLQSLCPVPVPARLFALPGEPTPAPLAIGGLLALVAVLLVLAARRARRLEVSYGGD